MKEMKKAKVYKSDILSDFLSTITAQEIEETNSRMRIAAKIADAMKAKGINKSTLAKLLNQNNSVITKWLSGTHNYTTDTLELIGNALDISLLNEYEAKPIILDKKKIVRKSNMQKSRFWNTELDDFTFIGEYELQLG